MFTTKKRTIGLYSIGTFGIFNALQDVFTGLLVSVYLTA